MNVIKKISCFEIEIRSFFRCKYQNAQIPSKMPSHDVRFGRSGRRLISPRVGEWGTFGPCSKIRVKKDIKTKYLALIITTDWVLIMLIFIADD